MEFITLHSSRGPGAYIRWGGLITQGMFFVFQVGGPINGEAHKVGIYKLEVYGRFKGWGSR